MAKETEYGGSLIQVGNFTLHSGKKADFKLVADQFIRDNLEGLVHLIATRLSPFGSVEGIPRGGTLIADALKAHVSRSSDTHLIVDDVLTTGGSFQRAWEERHKANGNPKWIKPGYYIRGVVVFARGQCPPWVKEIFQMPRDFWLG